MTTESKARPQKLVFKRTAQNPGLSAKEKPSMATMAKSLLDAAGQLIKRASSVSAKKKKRAAWRFATLARTWRAAAPNLSAAKSAVVCWPSRAL